MTHDPVWSEAATVQLIATLGVVLAALVTVGVPAWFKLRSMGRDLHVTREHVANTHDTNLRDDVDLVMKMTRENRELIRAVAAEVRAINAARTRRPRWWPSRRGSGHRP